MAKLPAGDLFTTIVATEYAKVEAHVRSTCLIYQPSAEEICLPLLE
jgi:hypothetical protein